MKTILTLFAATVAVSLFTGCDTTTFTPAGQPSYVSDAGFPIYNSAPTKPYKVIGTIQARNQRAAISKAQIYNADALIFAGTDREQVGAFHNSHYTIIGNQIIGGGDSTPLIRRTSTYLAIKFTPQTDTTTDTKN